MDAQLPQPTSETLISTTARRFPRSRILVVSDRFREAEAFGLLRLGVKGLVPYSDLREKLLENLSNKQIADRLHISERTVKFHVSNLLAKFQLPRRQDLILHCLGLAARDRAAAGSRRLTPEP